MVNRDRDRPDSDLPAEKRQNPRKVVPASKNLSVVMGQPDSSFTPSREVSRKIPTEALNARLLAAQNANCTIEDISESGVRICHSVNLHEGETVGIFFQISLGETTEDKGFTLLCQVIWHKPWKASKGLGHLTGLNIIHKSDSASYKKFVDSLPSEEKAHA